ncbi:endonuclease/exonuclease/phosphatase family protein [Streptococcus pneumoniae]
MAKFLSLNTHSWMEDQQEEKLQDLVTRILTQDYDVICLQEVNQLMDDSQEIAAPLYYQPAEGIGIHEDHYALRLVEELAKQGQTYHWSWAYNHIGFDRFHEGVAILSKKPLKAKVLTVSDMDDPTDYHTRKVLLVETEVHEKEITVGSVHLSWWDKGFQEEWARLETALVATSYPLVLMGDFNNPVDYEGYQEIVNSSLNLQDSHKTARDVRGTCTVEGDIAGWEGNRDALKIDYLFASKDWTIERSHVVFDGENGPVISDHYGLEVEMTL